MSFLKEYPQLALIQSLAKRSKVQLYLVGGFLRDRVLGVKKLDFDFAVSKNALKLARIFSQEIKGVFVLLDEENKCARVVKKINGQIITYDFSDFRANTFQEDLKHRDFTINTLAADINSLSSEDKIIEFLLDHNGAIKDIKAKKIKMVTSQVFKEDPLRMLRAFSLQANLSFKIEPTTLRQIKKDKDLIKTVSTERVREELFKVLMSPRATKNIKLMDKIGLLERIIPQIRIMYHCYQGGYHHLDVWKHTLEALSQFEKIVLKFENSKEVREYLNEKLGGERTRLALIKLALLLHDIGKPDAKRKRDGKLYFYGHEKVGKEIVRAIAQMLKLSNDERHALEDMVFWHLRPGYLSNFKNPTAKAIYRYFRDTKREAVSILLLSLADQRATRGPMTTKFDQENHEKICLRLVKQYFAQAEKKPFARLIDGNDLIKILKLTPSPIFKEILTKVEEEQMIGKITNKKQALSLAKQIACTRKQK